MKKIVIFIGHTTEIPNNFFLDPQQIVLFVMQFSLAAAILDNQLYLLRYYKNNQSCLLLFCEPVLSQIGPGNHLLGYDKAK